MPFWATILISVVQTVLENLEAQKGSPAEIAKAKKVMAVLKE